jgi:hypothetical protein
VTRLVVPVAVAPLLPVSTSYSAFQVLSF